MNSNNLKIIRRNTSWLLRLAVLEFLIMFFISNASYACKNKNYDYILNMNSKELAREGCTKEHLRLLNANDVDAIKIVKHMKKIGLADKNSLNRMAFTYYRLGKFKEALSARLAANKSDKNCLLLSWCTWYPDMYLHYENAVFYRAAGLKEDYDREMWIGNIHFIETCPLLWNNAPNRYEECTQIRNRYLNGVYKTFGYDILWDDSSDGYLSIFNN